jgi:hypothetical protein
VYSGGRQGVRSPCSLAQPRQGKHADGDGFHAPEAHTTASTERDAEGSIGVCRAWHAESEALLNVGDPRGSWPQVGPPDHTEGGQ